MLQMMTSDTPSDTPAMEATASHLSSLLCNMQQYENAVNRNISQIEKTVFATYQRAAGKGIQLSPPEK